VRPILCVALACLLAGVATAPALGAPTIAVTTTCAYTGGQFAIAGRGFAPGARLALDIMGTHGSLAGAAIGSRSATADARGTFLEILDVPPAGATTPVLRAVRARPTADDSPAPFVLASASLRSVDRGARVSPAKPELAAGATQRWHLTGLPEGTALYAHYRAAGRTVARRSLGASSDPCGRLDFDLPVLPRGGGHRGAWEVWVTADRSFRRPRRGVYLRRQLTADGSSPRARVRVGRLASRLTPLDPRFSTPMTNGMAADASQIGLLSLTFVAAQGAAVEFLERIGDRLVRLGTSSAGPDELITVLKDATTWSCKRPERRFLATATLPGGSLALATYSVRTPSCAGRFRLSAPRRVAPGGLVRVRVVDRWGIGAIRPELCVTPPRRPRRCHRVPLGPAVTIAGRRFRGRARGDWVVQLRVGDRSVARTLVRVGGERGAATEQPPTVLAAGDSTMQGIDGFLADELGDDASVVSDVRIGTGISRSGQGSLPGAGDASTVQWALLATQQTARLHQRATVVSLGANEGFAMTTPQGARVTCCDAAWTAEYARRTRLTMQAYAPVGRGRVLWLTLPLPRSDERRAITSAVNGAIVSAAAGLTGVKVLRMDVIFTPDGYRDVIRYRGRDVDVRDIDGVHLNVAGTAIAGKVVAKELGRP